MELKIIAVYIALLWIVLSLFFPYGIWAQELKKYQNEKYGLSFQYPSEWGEPSDFDCKRIFDLPCQLDFSIIDFKSNASVILSNKETTFESFKKAYLNASYTLDSANVTWEARQTAAEVLKEALSQKSKFYVDSIFVNVIKLDEPKEYDKPCNCNTLKDFVTWDYNSLYKDKTFLNDNQTFIGKNYSAWQTEILLDDENYKLTVYSINGNTGYIFSVRSSPERLNLYLNDFKNMLKSVELETPKIPSFLDSR